MHGASHGAHIRFYICHLHTSSRLIGEVFVESAAMHAREGRYDIDKCRRYNRQNEYITAGVSIRTTVP